MDFWKKCTTCKNAIPFNGIHYLCNVSTCNQRVNQYVFCSVHCWDAHVPTMRHRESWAVETKTPSPSQWAQMQKEAEQPIKRNRQPKMEAPVAKVSPSIIRRPKSS